MLIALIIIVSFVIAIIIAVNWFIATAKKEYSDRTEIMIAETVNAEKALIVYQPGLTSAPADVAYSIGKGLNDSGFEVTLTNPRQDLSSDISDYEVIVFGMPNYGSAVPEALSNYIGRIDSFTGKRILLFSTSGGAEQIIELEKLTELLRGETPFAAVKYQFKDIETIKNEGYRLGVRSAE
ncbi:MAG: hypothetical protein JXQ23_03310 [Clostridia bacterium]|nr:hypothetical protein [Clostridia bacterium]